MCWTNPGGAGVFDSNHAADVGLRLSQTVGATIAQLERERDEARWVRDHYIQQYARAIDLLKEADAARADAARMRLALSRLNECVCGLGEASYGQQHYAYCPYPVTSAALTPDDGWLASKLAEAVEPYREALRRLDGLRESPAPNYPEECECDREDESDEATLCLLHARMFFSLERNTLCFMLVDMMAATGQYSTAIEAEARALLGGTPGGDE